MIFSDVTLNGLSLVASPDAYGVKWRCPMSTIAGWWGTPAPVVDTRQRPRGHGVWVGESWLPGRAITLNGWCEADSRAAVQSALDRLGAAAALTDVPLTIADSGQTLSADVRAAGEVSVRWVHSKLAKWAVPLFARDPRKLGTALTGSTRLPSVTGGLTIPFTLPKAITAVVSSGQIALTNPGNFDGPVMLRVDGPVVAPKITHVNSGRSLVLGSSLSLGAGEYLIFDLQRQEVLAQGQSSRGSTITDRGWSAFRPGPNVWAFAAQSGTGTLTATARPAWK